MLTAVGIAVDVAVGSEPATELTEDPLLALMFLAMAWHARRKLAAERSHRLISEHNARLLADQRRFLQDAAHQLRTPITIALGHAELLATAVDGQQEAEDIDVVIGELSRLRRISERLLVIAAAADPAFLHPEPVALDQLIAELIRRWRPAADRSWRIARLDQVTVPGRPGAARPGARRAARERRPAYRQQRCHTVVCHPGLPRDASPDHRRRYRQRHPGGRGAAHLRPVQHRSRTGSPGGPAWDSPWCARWPAPMAVT